MSIDPLVYIHDPVYKAISHRFAKNYGIVISKHIHSVEKIYWRNQEGFEFVAKSPGALVQALVQARFQHDARDRIFGIIPSLGTFAALATTGEGYREQSVGLMLHCAVSNDLCSVHLDDTAFVLDGYNANAGQHIANDLIWQTGIVANVAKLSVPVASVLSRFHPIVPNLHQFKPLSEVGAGFDIYTRGSDDEKRVTKVTLDFTHSCSDHTCGALKAIDGQKIEGSNQVFLKLEIIGL